MRQEIIRNSLHFLGCFVLAWTLGGCSHVQQMVYSRPFEPASAVAFRRLVARSARQPTGAISSPLLWAYSNYLGPIIYSECRSAPSDSGYLRFSFEAHCPAPVALLSAIGRLLREHDLATVSPHHPFTLNHHIVWPDFPRSCQN